MVRGENPSTHERRALLRAWGDIAKHVQKHQHQECKNIGLHKGVVLETTEVPKYSPVFSQFSQSQFLLESNFVKLSPPDESRVYFPLSFNSKDESHFHVFSVSVNQQVADLV